MKTDEILIVRVVNDILEIKNKNPSEIDEKLVSILIKESKIKLEIDLIGYANKALKLKNKNPKLSKKEIIQKVLDDAKSI